jgi:hypothetical protein
MILEEDHVHELCDVDGNPVTVEQARYHRYPLQRAKGNIPPHFSFSRLFGT